MEWLVVIGVVAVVAVALIGVMRSRTRPAVGPAEFTPAPPEPEPPADQDRAAVLSERSARALLLGAAPPEPPTEPPSS